MATLTITLCDEDREFILWAIRSGRYGSESEAVADAIASLRAREISANLTNLADFRKKIAEGISQLEGGKGGEWDPDRVRTKGQLLASRPPAN